MHRMRAKMIWLLALMGTATFGCQNQKEKTSQKISQSTVSVQENRPPAQTDPAHPKNMVQYPKNNGQWIPYEPGVVVVKFKEGYTKTIRDEVLAQEFGISRIAHHRIGVDRMRLLTDEDVERAAVRIAQDPRVAYAEPNWKIRLLNTPNDSRNTTGDFRNTPNDPRYNECWGLNNTGQTGGTADADIDAVEAWDISIGSRNVVVAVLDTGVDYNHPDLAANIWNNADEIPGNGIDDDNNGYVDDTRGWDMEHANNNPMDDYGHGTHCSGTIGAVGNNNLGVAGVNWQVSIMPVRIIGQQDLEGYCVDAAEGIRYAVDNGARAMSCSWWTVQHYSQTLEDAVAYANTNGVLLIAAAGNEGGDNESPNLQVWPCEWPYDNIICVAATDHNDNKADFSCWGQISVDVAAPGVDVLSTVWPGGSYETMSGTSMATPHTAGTVALMLSIRPELTAAEVKQYLLSTVDPIADFQGLTVTGGRINALTVMQAISGVPLPPVALAGGEQTVLTGTTVTLDGTRSFDPNQDPITYQWDFFPPQHSSAQISDPAAAAPTFLADVCGLFQANLTVTDDGGLMSQPDRAKVHVMNQSEYALSSGPYPSNANLTWTITVPSAVVMSVHFLSLDTERGYDYVHVLDGSGVEWARYDGQSGPFTTVSVEGNTIVLNLTSDNMTEGNGFVIDYIWWCDAGNCPPGQGDCDNDPSNGCETDTSSSVLNCGWCGHVCSYAHAAATCENRICTMGDCEAGWYNCDGDNQNGCEAKFETDPNHCGDCDTVCSFDNAVPGCADFTCTIGSCIPGWDNCDGILNNGCEQDVSGDVGNCGACNHVCQLDHAVGHSCIDSVCYPLGNCSNDTSETYESDHPYGSNYDHMWTITRPGAARMSLHFARLETEAGYDKVRIYDRDGAELAVYEGIMSDFNSPFVPGDMIKVRLTSDSSVTGWGFLIDSVNSCESGCDVGWGNCDGDPSNGCESSVAADVNNCGGCGQVCGGANTTSVCQDSVCQASTDCLTGYADCDANPANGCEVDLNTNAQHCNTCGNACDYPHASGACVGGVCELGACDYGFGDCTADPGCETSINTDPANCGACANTCSGLDHVLTYGCGSGFCTIGSCETGWADCDHNPANGCEKPVVDDPNNCGGCGLTCNLAHATAHCSGVTCIIDSCSTGYGNCDDNVRTGCESNLSSNVNNCGTCGNPCVFANAVASCQASTCQMGACNNGFADCNDSSADGCEVNLKSNSQNCGTCGQVCTAAHASGGCSGGSCALGTCDEGYGNCNNNPADGCEIHIAQDPINCGACEFVCQLDNATPACATGACVVAGCNEGFGDCNSDPVDGCEAGLSDNVQHCGACNNACDLPNAIPLCRESVCRVGACDTGFGNCDALADNGCEVNLGNDSKNCGACGVACDAGKACVNSICTCPDADGDGHGALPCGDDCNDKDRNVYPGATEVCDDSIDNNCDGQTDENCEEIDDGTGCGGCSTGSADASVPLLGFGLLGLLLYRRRR